MLKWGPQFVLIAAALTFASARAQEPGAFPQRPSAAPAPGGEAGSFDVYEYQVEGNTKLETRDIENAVYPFLGPGKTITDVEGARKALEKAYHDHGFLTALVNIPPQKVAGGVVTLKVLEAPVGELRIVGSRYHSLEAIRAVVPQLAEGNVPNFNEVQKELSQLNRSPDSQVTPVLRASETPGQVDVELQVKDKLPLHASLELNNDYTPETHHLRAIGDVHYDNLFQSSQSLDFSYQTSPENPKEVKVFSLSYAAPLTTDTVLAMYAVRNDSSVSTVGNLNVLGNGQIFGLRLINTLPGGGTRFYHNITAGIDYKDFKQDLVLQGADTGFTPVHYAPLSLQYNATWLGARNPDAKAHAPLTTTSGGLGTSFALRGIGSDNREFSVKRFGASASYFIFHPSLQRVQALPYDWSLVAKADAQWANGPLISNEQYAAGGYDNLRGYLVSEALGDNGYHGSFELHTPYLGDFWPLKSFWQPIDQANVFAFFDAARLTVRDPLPGQISRYNLASAGLGLQFKAHGFALGLDAAHTLFRGPTTSRDANRGLFRVDYGF